MQLAKGSWWSGPVTDPSVYCRALALLACAVHASPSGSLLIPNDEKDFSSMLSALMESQHSVLQKVHGVDSPQVALSTSMLSLQSSVRAPCKPDTSVAAPHRLLVDLGSCLHAHRVSVGTCPATTNMRVLQVSTLMANLTSEYKNFIGFITTTPSWFASLANDVVLINRQLNAVSARS